MSAVHSLRVDGEIPYVPTPIHIVRAMMDMARVTPHDFVIDLGAGDGRILRIAAKEYGARGIGFEIDEDRVRLAAELARRDGVSDRVSFIHGDLYDADISAASVLTMYLLPEPVNRLRGKLLAQLKPGSRVVSEDFKLRGWTARRMGRYIAHEKQSQVHSAITYLWQYVVPESAP